MNNHLLVNKLDNLTLDKLKNICDAPVVLKLVKEIIKSKDAVDSDGLVNTRPDGFTPSVDIISHGNNDKYIIYMDIPGLSEKDI